jgi:hypothetical protein
MTSWVWQGVYGLITSSGIIDRCKIWSFDPGRKAIIVRVSAGMLACTVLILSLSAQAQTVPVEPDQGKPCVAKPEATKGNIGIVSDTQGVDFTPYLQRVVQITHSSWTPLVPKEVEAPIFKTGEVKICFKILPNGKVKDRGMVLQGRSGDVALDRAAWGAISTSLYPPLPAEFKGPYLELLVLFKYNSDHEPMASRKTPRARRPKALNLTNPLILTLSYHAKLRLPRH